MAAMHIVISQILHVNFLIFVNLLWLHKHDRSFTYLYSHGRDNSLKVWQLPQADESTFSQVLPNEDQSSHHKQPWLLHSLAVNTLNFCSFATCPSPPATKRTTSDDGLLIAVPSTKDAEVDIFQLPTEKHYSRVPAVQTTPTGMVMAVRLHHFSGNLLCITGYESGHTAIHSTEAPPTKPRVETSEWSMIYLAQPHSQPILSLDISYNLECYYTSSADAIVAQHSLVTDTINPQPLKTVNTKHPGQQSLTVRSDSRIFATAGWDGRVRVYDAKKLKELAVLKWHGEGCYAVAFADVPIASSDGNKQGEGGAKIGATTEAEGDSRAVASTAPALTLTVAEKREHRVKTSHWLAAGSKDGKVSLWEIY